MPGIQAAGSPERAQVDVIPMRREELEEIMSDLYRVHMFKKYGRGDKSRHITQRIFAIIEKAIREAELKERG